ncbi:MAG: 50S ribosomal protein L11 methyltransferase [bacterium]
MDYYEFKITGIPEESREILMAGLSEIGFESFQEEEDSVSGYIPVEVYRGTRVLSFLKKRSKATGLVYGYKRIKTENWNALWESQYMPVTVAGKCMVRAPFHDPEDGMKYNIVIEPKMSFGTAHHETTALMIGMIMKQKIRKRRVLDMGCGTGVLAILAWKMGASEVDAIDNDEWAFLNAKDNILKNNAPSISVIRGDGKTIPQGNYDFILANINRNVLLEDMPRYARHLAASGVLLLSGFYDADLEVIIRKAKRESLQYITSETNNHWAAAKFMK